MKTDKFDVGEGYVQLGMLDIRQKGDERGEPDGLWRTFSANLDMPYALMHEGGMVYRRQTNAPRPLWVGVYGGQKSYREITTKDYCLAGDEYAFIRNLEGTWSKFDTTLKDKNGVPVLYHDTKTSLEPFVVRRKLDEDPGEGFVRVFAGDRRIEGDETRWVRVSGSPSPWKAVACMFGTTYQANDVENGVQVRRRGPMMPSATEQRKEYQKPVLTTYGRDNCPLVLKLAKGQKLTPEMEEAALHTITTEGFMAMIDLDGISPKMEAWHIIVDLYRDGAQMRNADGTPTQRKLVVRIPPTVGHARQRAGWTAPASSDPVVTVDDMYET